MNQTFEERVLNLLTNVGQILEIVKGEWQECNCWSDWDEEQLKETVQIIRELYAKRGKCERITLCVKKQSQKNIL